MGTLASSIPALPAWQATMVDLIEREFVAAGYPVEVAAAAVVNAYAESSLNPRAVGDEGHSIGLFQLSDRGAGAGMTVAARQNPLTNVRTIIAREKRALDVVAQAAKAGQSVPRLAALFSTKVERPRDTTVDEAHRAALALRLFPAGVVSEATKRSVKPILTGAVIVSVVALVILRVRSRPASVTLQRVPLEIA